MFGMGKNRVFDTEPAVPECFAVLKPMPAVGFSANVRLRNAPVRNDARGMRSGIARAKPTFVNPLVLTGGDGAVMECELRSDQAVLRSHQTPP